MAVVIEKTHNLIAGISAVTTMRMIVVVTAKEKQEEYLRVHPSYRQEFRQDEEKPKK
jgi:hypothetical protein